jgi:glutathione synthase/RimK-type ligase-like ATP-grasp enzyme
MNKCADAAQLKILVFATQDSPLAARIAIALANAGFFVAAITPYGNPVREVRKVRQQFAYRTRPRLKSIIGAIHQWIPNLLVCTDDAAVRELQTLHQRTQDSRDKSVKEIPELIERSLGPPTSFSAIRDKSAFSALAERQGLRCPKTFVFPANRTFETRLVEPSYPIVVKADHSDGGRCVRIVGSDADLRATVWELQMPDTWRGRRFFGSMLGSEALRPFRLPIRRTISLQGFIDGRPANRAVVCWQGKVLAGISVEAVEETYQCGPASVVRLIDHAEMTMFCERMVKRLHLSGFVGFDFILDSANRAWILEMNPRVTQVCHFLLADGTDLAASLYMHMSGQRPQTNRQLQPSKIAPINRGLISLFPNEMIRSPSSNYLRSCQHDVPWEEPELVSSLLNKGMRMGAARRARTFLQYRFPSAVGALVRLGLIDGRTEENPTAISRADTSSVMLHLQDTFADRERTTG